MELERFCTWLGFISVCFIIIFVLIACGGCALFRSGSVEARANYNVVAQDCSVSIVAVGYIKE